MIYWILFFVISVFLLNMSTNSAIKNKDKRIFHILFLCFIIYFSAFRDGLGQDYVGYISKLEYDISFNILKEPLFELLSLIIRKTIFSEVFFFFVTSAITLTLIYNSLYKKNKYAFLSVYIFLFFPALYFNTFNIVRQFFASALFLYSFRYIESNNIKKYSLCILIAMLMHFSSIILFPFFYILRFNYNKKVIALTVLSFIIVFFSFDSTMAILSTILPNYEIYSSSDLKLDSSFMIVLYNVLLLLLLFKENKLDGSFSLYKKAFFIMVLFYDLSFKNYYFTRFALFFLPTICFMVPYIINLYMPKWKTNVLVVSFYGFLFFYILIQNINNPLIIPSDILTLSRLFD